jgi:hypothetical protein
MNTDRVKELEDTVYKLLDEYNRIHRLRSELEEALKKSQVVNKTWGEKLRGLRKFLAAHPPCRGTTKP